MEKRLILFLVLSMGIIFLYYQIFPPPPPKPPKTEEPPPAEAPVDPAASRPDAPVDEGAGEPASPEAAPEPAGPTLPAVVEDPDAGETETFDTPRVRWTVDTWGGTVRQALLKDYALRPGQDLSDPAHWYPAIADRGSGAVFGDGDQSYGQRSLALDVIDGNGNIRLRTSRMLWQMERLENGVVFRLPLPTMGVVLEKRITFPDEVDGLEGGAYHADVVVAARIGIGDSEKAKAAFPDGLRLRLVGPGGMPLDPETASGMGPQAAIQTRDVYGPEQLAAPEEIGEAESVWPEPEDQKSESSVSWAGIHGQFFTAILKAKDPRTLDARQAVVLPVRDRLGGRDVANLAVAIDFQLPNTLTISIGGGAGQDAADERSFLFYAGPLDGDVFDAPAYEAFDPMIDYGFFGFVSKPLVLLLDLFHSLVGNWGVAIILLTLFVRIAMFPLSRKQQVSMQRYQRDIGRLKPKLDALKKKYGDNRRKFAEEQMKLMRAEGVRMFPGGCLIMFLQLPIFIGLFQALRYTVGLRHSGFLWVEDLTAPDKLFRLPDLPLLPEWFNLLPILMAFTWWLSTALAPKPTDPQQAQTMKMMQWMPIIFSLLLYSYPAGLALYMVVSSSWSIFETKVVKRLLFKEDQAIPAPAVAAAPKRR